MAGALDPLISDRRALLVIAAPLEARAVLDALGPDADPERGRDRVAWTPAALTPRLDLVVTGVGKASAAAGAARALDPGRHAIAVSLGVAGALPGSGLEPADALAATRSVFGDEGLLSGEGFAPVDALGFPPFPDGGSGADADPAALEVLRGLAGDAGTVACVSTISGTDELARAVAERTGARAEAMEGAAVAVAAARLGVPFAELRVISNTTGDRARQRWDLPGALARLGAIAAEL